MSRKRTNRPAKLWQQMEPLEQPHEGDWCDDCRLPSVATRRFLHAIIAQTEKELPTVTHCQVLTLTHCRDCHDTYWKEYREAAQARDDTDT